MSARETVIRPGAGVEATGGRLGSVDEVRVRPETGELALLVVRRGWSDALLHVAAAQVDRVEGDGTVRLRSTRGEAERLAADVRGAGRSRGSWVRMRELHDTRAPGCHTAAAAPRGLGPWWRQRGSLDGGLDGGGADAHGGRRRGAPGPR